MESDGKYVRAPKYFEQSDPNHSVESSSADIVNDDENQSERSFCSSIASDFITQETRPELMERSNDSEPDIEKEPNAVDQSSPSTRERLQRMESVLSNITKAISSMQTMRPTYDADQNWCTSVSNQSDTSLPSIRWDNIKPFPTGVPANKMWEEWNRYIENFEIAASLSNANDPVRRSQLLFLSIGDELQGIVRAAKLRPSLNDANCYRNFVANISNYFQSMTDSAAEHESFSNMRQEKSESAIAFHARLMAKVRLCGYSPSDQDRFVRAQLLKGLTNKELVKAARTYGHDTNYIVQAATRNEAYEAETVNAGPSDPSESYTVNRLQQQSINQQQSRKRTSSDGWVDRAQSLRFRKSQQEPRRDRLDRGRRSRCLRCNGRLHSNYPCPALKRNCNSCGELGHYAATCRKSRIRELQIKTSEEQDDAQVLNN